MPGDRAKNVPCSQIGRVASAVLRSPDCSLRPVRSCQQFVSTVIIGLGWDLKKTLVAARRREIRQQRQQQPYPKWG